MEVLRFTDKSGIYPVEYHYAERCASFARDTVRIAPEPFVRVADDRMVSGWCHPVELGIACAFGRMESCGREANRWM